MSSIKLNVNLARLERIELDKAWLFLRTELEKQLAKLSLVCVPSFHDSELYDSSCVFVETAAMTYAPIGKLQELINKENTDPFWHNIYDKTIIMKDDGTPPDYHLGLRDRARRIKIDVQAKKMQRRTLPNDLPHMYQVFLNGRANSELMRADTIHVVYDVIGANELTVSVSDEVDVDLYSIETWKPILIGFKSFQLNTERRIVDEITENRHIYNAVRRAWSRM